METPGKALRVGRIEQRFIWMLLNYEKWRGFPPQPAWQSGNYEPWSRWTHEYGARLLREMKKDGIISEKTDVCCVPNMHDMMQIIRTGDKKGFYKYVGHLAI